MRRLVLCLMRVCGRDVQRRFGAEPAKRAATLKRCSATRQVSESLLHPCPLLEVKLPRQSVTGAAVVDPNRRFARVICRTAKGLADHLVGAGEKSLGDYETFHGTPG